MSRPFTTITTEIPSGEALSSEVDLGDWDLEAILTPAAWTTAALTFLGTTTSGGTDVSLFEDAGNEISVACAVDRYISITGTDKTAIRAIRWLTIRSGTLATPVNQASARTLTLVLRKGQ